MSLMAHTTGKLNCIPGHFSCSGKALLAVKLQKYHSYTGTMANSHRSSIVFAVDQVKFGPPVRKVTEPYPNLVIQDTFMSLWYSDNNQI